MGDICGFLGYGHIEKNDTLDKMIFSMVPANCDCSGKYIDGYMSAAANDECQLLFDEDKNILIVLKGEIYNIAGLKESLDAKGYIFSKNTDAEALLYSYCEYGADMLNMLRGAFCFVIWESNTQTLFAARDHFGTKPFYYTEYENNNIIFSTEIRSLIKHPSYKKELNHEALESYLSFQYSILPESFFKGIYKLPPAHYMLIKDGQAQITKYWEPKFEPQECTEEEAVQTIDTIVQDSIEVHSMGNEEIGSLLSGGVDSSYIATCFQGDKTFTVGFGYEKYNEIEYAKSLCQELGINNFSKIVTADEFFEILPSIQFLVGEPLADPAVVPLFFACELASDHVNIVFSGEGPDEFFGGYNIYKEPLDLARIQKLPRFVRKFLAACVRMIPFSFKGKNYILRASKSVEERFIGNANIFSLKERNRVLKNPSGKISPQDVTRPLYEKCTDYDDISKMQYIDINTWLVGDELLLADKISAAHMLTLRVPLMDRYVFDVASKLPVDLRVNKENTKYAFRKAALKHMPPVTASRKKLGFPVPIRMWLREEKYFNMVMDTFLSSDAALYFDVNYLIKLLRKHRSGKKDNSRKIWTIYAFLIWYNDYFNQ